MKELYEMKLSEAVHSGVSIDWDVVNERIRKWIVTIIREISNDIEGIQYMLDNWRLNKDDHKRGEEAIQWLVSRRVEYMYRFEITEKDLK